MTVQGGRPLPAVRLVPLAEAPGDVGWVTRVVWDVEGRRAVGRAGFHGPPDDHGMGEIGYAIDPDFRRQGWARAPDNAVSRRLALASGFVQVGEQVEDEDGRELVYERLV